MLGAPQDVDDIVHDTFLQVQRGLPKLREPAALKPWIATITVRVTRRQLRRARARRLFQHASAPSLDAVASSSMSREDYEFLHGVYAALERLSANERIAWALRRVHGARLATVAEMCECSLATVKRRVASADRKLERWMESR